MAQPNIILILADDMGYSDIGCFGSEIQTPNLDRLAGNGARFSQMYSFARCCPSRAALLTGLHPQQAGVGHMVQNRGTRAYQGYLRDDAVTIAEVLKGAGYRTMMSGKWHVGGQLYTHEPESGGRVRKDFPRPSSEASIASSARSLARAASSFRTRSAKTANSSATIPMISTTPMPSATKLLR